MLGQGVQRVAQRGFGSTGFRLVLHHAATIPGNSLCGALICLVYTFDLWWRAVSPLIASPVCAAGLAGPNKQVKREGGGNGAAPAAAQAAHQAEAPQQQPGDCLVYVSGRPMPWL